MCSVENDGQVANAVSAFGDEICERNPLISIVLTAHLKIEAEADRLIRLNCKKPESLDTTRLSASHKFKLCEALWGNPGGDDQFWQSLERLNALRNEIAHGLRQNELEKKLRAFIGSISADEMDNEGQELEDSLVICLCYLFHDMSQLEHYFAHT